MGWLSMVGTLLSLFILLIGVLRSPSLPFYHNLFRGLKPCKWTPHSFLKVCWISEVPFFRSLPNIFRIIQHKNHSIAKVFLSNNQSSVSSGPNFVFARNLTCWERNLLMLNLAILLPHPNRIKEFGFPLLDLLLVNLFSLRIFVLHTSKTSASIM